MYTFWKVLSQLIQEYTIAETAYVFSIVEGLATVVAAVGAIIAVVITKKIALEQISIAEKQNEISEKQADIAETQNKIALFDKRYSAYIAINNISYLKELLDANADFITFIKAYNVIFCTNFSVVDNTESAFFEIIKHIKIVGEGAVQIIFLFNFIEESDVQEIYDNLGELFTTVTENKKASAEYKNFSESIDRFDKKYRKKIEEVLYISNAARTKMKTKV